MEATDGLLSSVSAIEADTGQHDFGRTGFYDGAFFELFDNLTVGISEFKRAKGGSFWWGSVILSVIFFERMVFLEPCLIVDVEFFDVEGDKACSFLESDLLGIVGDEVGFERFFTI